MLGFILVLILPSLLEAFKIDSYVFRIEDLCYIHILVFGTIVVRTKRWLKPVMVGDVELREKGEGAVSSSVASVHRY